MKKQTPSQKLQRSENNPRKSLAVEVSCALNRRAKNAVIKAATIAEFCKTSKGARQ
jgi:hypothetical protein